MSCLSRSDSHPGRDPTCMRRSHEAAAIGGSVRLSYSCLVVSPSSASDAILASTLGYIHST
jgi:hypothetical protein